MDRRSLFSAEVGYGSTDDSSCASRGRPGPDARRAAGIWPARTGFAFEDFIAPLTTAKTVRCTVVAQMQGQPVLMFKSMFHDASWRQESEELGNIGICDETTGTTLMLDVGNKQATIFEYVNRDPQAAESGGFLQTIRNFLLMIDHKKPVKRQSLGERKLAGRTLVGYRITEAGSRLDVWGDPKTGFPHTVASNMAAFPNMEITFTDFEFDVELDDSLFSLVPPEGYEVTKQILDASKPAEEDLVAALRRFAELNDGVYPDAINMLEGIKMGAKLRSQLEKSPAAEQEEQVIKLRTHLARGFNFALQLPADAEAGYAGKGLSQADGDKSIFWYKPTGAEKYRVIRADLTSVDADEPPRVDDAQRFAPIDGAR